MSKNHLFFIFTAIFIALGLVWNKPALASLPPGNAIKDPYAILRNALPIEQKDLRKLQGILEETNESIRGNRWSNLNKAAASSTSIISKRQNQIIESIPKNKQKKASLIIATLKQNIENLEESTSEKNKFDFIDSRDACLQNIGDLEALLLKDEFPFEIPEEFNELPRLLGRAEVMINTSQGKMKAIIDGYNAPLTAGAFIDLVEKEFYNGLPFTRAEDFYVLQTGDPKGPEIGYINPENDKERHIPLEIRAPGIEETLYNQTFEDAGLYKETPVLPFATLGTLGWAHSNQAINDGSSQFFFFLYEAELTPAGRNLIDGRNSAFGYVIEGAEIIEKLGIEDKILSIKVINGVDNLLMHG